MPLLVVRRQSRIICVDRFSNQAAAFCRFSGGDWPLADSAKATRIRIEPRRAIRFTGESLAEPSPVGQYVELRSLVGSVFFLLPVF